MLSQKNILIAFLILFPAILIGQNEGKIRGVVTDSSNGEALVYCNIFIPETKTGTTTDENGMFTITSLASDRVYSVVASYIGYKTDTIKVFAYRNRVVDISIQLVPTSIELQTIEKVGEKIIEKNETDLGLSRIFMRNVESVPKGVETDIFRSLQILPGVGLVGDVSARYYVRGGESNQNLVLLDGIPVYNPFHALGMFSVIDPDMINSAEFYKSGFPTEYGGRVSSMLKINTKDGNRNKYTGAVTGSFMTLKGSIEGPIPSGSFFVSARKSYSNEILSRFLNGKNLPADFYDFSFKVNYKNKNFFDDSKFTVIGFFSGDKLKNDNPNSQDISWQNNLIGIKRFQIYDVPLYSEISVYISHFKGEIDPKESGARPVKNELTDFTFRSDFTYMFESSDELGIGGSLSSFKTKMFMLNQNGVFTDRSDFAVNITVYMKYRFIRYKNLGIEFGSRVNLEGLKSSGNFYFEPRINLTYRIVPQLAFKASWGRYQQGLTTLTDENEVLNIFEPWFLTPGYLVPARSIHYSAGIDFDASRFLRFSVETYYKILSHIPALNRNKIYPEDPDLVEGSGKSYGWEFLVKYNKYPFGVLASYTLGWAYKTVEDWTYYPKYDSRHNVKISADYRFGNGWSVSALWIYGSGLPFTPSNGYYNKYFFNDLSNYDSHYSGYSQYLLLGEINSKRLPDYHRLDLALNKSFRLSGVNFQASLNAVNVYDRKNIFYFERETGERVNMMPFILSVTLRAEI